MLGAVAVVILAALGVFGSWGREGGGGRLVGERRLLVGLGHEG